ncbi:MAG: hypothetical protein DRP85_08090 [Candidatus Makaraimicrobium thalassicum]|nr:MAG: hypothetical protein DRP85_08090 [Candidatus Omnitrophota bacterium]
MKEKNIKGVTLCVLFVFLLVMGFCLRPAGEPVNTEMDDYFITYGQVQTGSNNIVTSVVFDYRGMDTLGEASVLFAAASGVFLVFRGERNE